MTKLEFRTKVPGIIDHKAHGYGELQIFDSPQGKRALYRHNDNTTSHASYASSFAELFEKISGLLKKEGHI